MAEPLITIFGANASQTATDLVIKKADLYTTDPTGTKTAESLLVAILQKVQATLTSANFDANIDQSIIVTDSFVGSTSRGTPSVTYKQFTKSITLHKIDNDTVINPDDY